MEKYDYKINFHGYGMSEGKFQNLMVSYKDGKSRKLMESITIKDAYMGDVTSYYDGSYNFNDFATVDFNKLISLDIFNKSSGEPSIDLFNRVGFVMQIESGKWSHSIPVLYDLTFQRFAVSFNKDSNLSFIAFDSLDFALESNSTSDNIEIYDDFGTLVRKANLVIQDRNDNMFPSVDHAGLPTRKHNVDTEFLRNLKTHRNNIDLRFYFTTDIIHFDDNKKEFSLETEPIFNVNKYYGANGILFAGNTDNIVSSLYDTDVVPFSSTNIADYMHKLYTINK